MTARSRNILWLISKGKKLVERMLGDHRRSRKPGAPGSDQEQGEKQMRLEIERAESCPLWGVRAQGQRQDVRQGWEEAVMLGASDQNCWRMEVPLLLLHQLLRPLLSSSHSTTAPHLSPLFLSFSLSPCPSPCRLFIGAGLYLEPRVGGVSCSSINGK